MKHLENRIIASRGPGRISDDMPIDLTEYVMPRDIAYREKVVRRKNYQQCFSMKIGGTVFDVTTHFNTEGRQTVLQQFRDLILSEHLV
ncbi:MAG: hypothetical protein ACLUBZ_13325 [Ruthenibacterium lactatiformans]|uniref:hypothetical protein n=1 Tax=Ruthenibacterium lactatiformans TaxID=1550024 RepID=UPI0006D7DD1C